MFPGATHPLRGCNVRAGSVGPGVHRRGQQSREGSLPFRARTTTLLTTQRRADAGGAAPAWRTRWQAYDGLGRVLQTADEAAAGLTVVNTSFDARGLAWRVSVPHRVAGNGGAFLEADWAGTGGSEVRTTFDELGRAQVVTLPDGRTTETAYDGWDREAIDPNRHKRWCEQDALGRLVAVKEYTGTDASWLLHATTSYAYDDLDRLVGASAPVDETFGYDAIGNLTRVIRAGQTTLYTYPPPGAPQPHAVLAAGATRYAYDATGSLVARGSQTLSYDPTRRPVRVDGGGVVARFACDAQGVRRKRLDAAGTVHYLGSYERNVGTGLDPTETATTYYQALGRLLAFRRNGVLFWVGTDHLGSPLRVADAGFQPLAAQGYTPFGVPRDAGAPLGTDRGFTGQTWDAAIGLAWYRRRAYDPALGRFTQPDRLVPAPGDPQRLNRYSYVGNNPLRYTDPSGEARVLRGQGGLEDVEVLFLNRAASAAQSPAGTASPIYAAPPWIPPTAPPPSPVPVAPPPAPAPSAARASPRPPAGAAPAANSVPPPVGRLIPRPAGPHSHSHGEGRNVAGTSYQQTPELSPAA